ncbi:MAG TPA: NACHT domain-containing protein [Pseudonocardiaceae bacterium]|nr:NACHT domain-containing protein [Pseudonocardiaceae bacterium]
MARRRGPRGYSFDKYYVIPSITRRRAATPTPELTGAGTDSANAITSARRVLLLGGAGAGKTTFLTWLANDVARRHDTEGPWHRIVPFLISLRYFAETDLPDDPELLLAAVAPTLAEEKPEGWVTELFVSGRAMVLVDGLDELVADRRVKAQRWVEKRARSYALGRHRALRDGRRREPRRDQGGEADPAGAVRLADGAAQRAAGAQIGRTRPAG